MDAASALKRALGWQHACVPSRRPVPVSSKVGAHGAQHNTRRPTTQRNRNARREDESLGRAITYFASSTNPGRGVDVFVTSTLLSRGREKYAAPKTFCAITTIFLLWLISRRGRFGRVRASPVTIGPRRTYRPKLLTNAMSDGATDAKSQSLNSCRDVLRANFGKSYIWRIFYVNTSHNLISLS